MHHCHGNGLVIGGGVYSQYTRDSLMSSWIYDGFIERLIGRAIAMDNDAYNGV